MKDKSIYKMLMEIEEAPLDSPSQLPFSSIEAKQLAEKDVLVMGKIIGKASQQVVKTMMNGVKSGKYDALDIVRGIETGKVNRTHEGERPFLRMLFRKVRSGFRRYMPKGKLRK